MKSNSEWLDDSSHSYCSTWMDTEPATFKSCNGHSFAMEARVRLDHLKSGFNSPAPCFVTDGTLNNYNSQKNASDRELKEEESALDSVELLDVEEDGEQDEESWLYESPKKTRATEEKSASALTWCRHVLDNPGPEVEAACRQLMNRLDGRQSSHLYRRPAVCHRTVGKSSGNTTQNSSHSQDNNKLSISNNSINTNYRLEDITDVRIMAQIQEASLSQDYVSVPRRSPESPFYFNTAVENTDDFTPGKKNEVSSPSRRSPRLLSQSSPSSQSPTSAASQSPKLARLHQQVTQFKMLKLTQNQAASAGRTRSPVRTSLRSLQAVRNSRSFETDDHLPAHQTNPAASGEPSARMEPSSWSPSPSAASVNSSSARDHLVRIAAMKRPQRSQSLSPCRIAQSAKVYLSRHGRVFASPEWSTPLAWVRYAPRARQ